MSARRKPLLTALAIVIVALAQTAVLVYMVVDRTQLLRNGREIVLPVLPYDPRDLFRGEYVFLNYPIARVPMKSGDGAPLRRPRTVYVTLERSADGEWRPIEASDTLKQPDDPNRIVLKGRTRGWAGGTVRYGIERYFVRQGEGPKLEARTRQHKLSVLVAVGRDGTAAIKGLIIDGKLQYEEPLL